MDTKKVFQVYYLLIAEGTTEFRLFAYLTRNKFRELFGKSNIKFSDKVNIVESGVTQGKLNGAGSLHAFKAKYEAIKKKYPGEKLFFFIDMDLNDSSDIGKMIRQDSDIIQFVEYNSEYLLLKNAGKNPKNPSEFKHLHDFRVYCKAEFIKRFGKIASDFKDTDFDQVFNNVSDQEIKDCFAELFATLSG